uniref:Uncharacterized protein n=1 Tax=Anguilla anguilla TaxID=7936 RepID=A0A0E9TNI6_ANGAN
MALIYSSLPFY